MYDFLIANNLTIVDFKYPQPVSYTYFCHKNCTYTWIDHILSTFYDCDDISSCQIIPEECGNVGDHLPLRVENAIKKVHCIPGIGDSRFVSNPRPQWGDTKRQLEYRNILTKKLQCIPTLNMLDIEDQNDCQWRIDSYMQAINKAIHSATKEAGCTPEVRFNPKPYWCPELSRLREKKRFWWDLWMQNDQPRTGEVYRCYKAVKKLFRQVCRRNVSNLQKEEYRSISYRAQNLNKFWSSIKAKRRKKSNSSLQPSKLADYYSSIMQDNAKITEKAATNINRCA